MVSIYFFELHKLYFIQQHYLKKKYLEIKPFTTIKKDKNKKKTIINGWTVFKSDNLNFLKLTKWTLIQVLMFNKKIYMLKGVT